MNRKVAVIGVGLTPPRARSSDLSYKEMIYAAAVAAYADARLKPSEIDGFVTCAEDLLEGTSIFDEYTPDQLGAVQRPVHTITGDGLQGLAAAFQLIQTGLMNRVVLEAHSKASNILTLPHILNYALDPVLNRPLNVHPYAWAGMEMQAYLSESGTTTEDCARVVEKNKRAALANDRAPYGADLGWEAVMDSPPMFDPLKESEVARHSDGAVIFVLAAGGYLPADVDPVWIRGIGWISDSPTLETRSWGEATYARLSAEMAYKMADIKDPAEAIDLAEIDDTFAYKELQHCDALGLFPEGAAAALRSGSMGPSGRTPINSSGGTLGRGNLLEANGLYRAAEIVLQIRGVAGKHQVRGASIGIAQAWRGVPTATGAAAIFSKK
ncbi:MAG: acetyl-CoA acetyltransferase [Planctomycetota bacterium]|nr:acetyl-CoA acetyltransferase [Planctomycetota bacterium]